ncbi:hypothetical protein [Aneurinibacillus sp. REN35]|uniref:hypothetical protein n=1 Tax=Aneurinibacillus sp. REN35 TaxID=3237286 RepID=UPI0035285816
MKYTTMRNILWIRILAIFFSFPIGLLAYYAACKIIYNQDATDLSSVALYGGMTYLIFGIPLFIGLFDFLRTKVSSASFGVVYMSCILASGVLLTLLVMLIGGGELRQIISAESILFGILYFVTDIVFGALCLVERKMYNI